MSYDGWKESAPEQDDIFAVHCPVCTGHEDADPCDESCAEIVERCRRERQIDACRGAAKLIVKMAKAYRREGFPDDMRVRVCLERVQFYRGQIRKLRAA
jgi:predicted nucleic acid-binding Zn ribbon protein